MWAAYGAAWLVRPFVVMMRDLFRLRGVTARRVYIPVAAVVVVAVLVITSTTAAGVDQVELLRATKARPTWSQYQEHQPASWTPSPPGRVHGRARAEARRVRHAPGLRDHPLLDTARHHGRHPDGGLLSRRRSISSTRRSSPSQPSNAIIGVDYPGLDVPAGHHPSAVHEHPLLASPSTTRRNVKR